MKGYAFTIKGNHKSRTGNAVPKLKMTGNQHWTPKAREYVQWKEHVVTAFLDSLRGPKTVAEHRLYCSNVARWGKPFVLPATEHGLMRLRIKWSNKAHGDPENIFGSIADALFANDKNLDCMTLSSMTDQKLDGKPAGEVEVVITLYGDEAEKIESVTKSCRALQIG